MLLLLKNTAFLSGWRRLPAASVIQGLPRAFYARATLSPKTSPENKIYFSKSLKELYTNLLNEQQSEEVDSNKWRKAYFFLRSYRHLLGQQSPEAFSRSIERNPELNELSEKAY